MTPTPRGPSGAEHPSDRARIRERRGWVAEHAGVRVVDAGLLPGLTLADLFGLALRVNPRRPHLLVSTVLGKHVPTDPRVVTAAGRLLGLRVAEALGGAPVPPDLGAGLGRVLRGEDDPGGPDGGPSAPAEVAGGEGWVLGYAETATALGHLVARTLGWSSIHSTRRRVPGRPCVVGFDEAHSHATEHLLLPDDAERLDRPGPVVLVDDELSTGRTVLGTVAALQRRRPRERYVVAALVDVRPAADRAAFAAAARDLGVRVDVVALAAGEVVLPHDLADRTAAALGGKPATEPPAPATGPGRVVPTEGRTWPWRVRETGRHGFDPTDDAALGAAAAAAAADLEPRLGGGLVLVLGTEELMYAPLALATALLRPGRSVRFSTTTRSPVRVLDVDGYPVRSGLRFAALDVAAGAGADPGDRFAYNLRAPEGAWTDVVVVVDSPAATARLDDLLAALTAYAQRVHTVVLPSAGGLPEGLRGPAFGSYHPAEVTWLLTDLSHVPLEAATTVRERAIQAGEAHYAESLPVEYQPEDTYQALFAAQLDAVAPRVAAAVGTVAELAVAVREDRDLVLASLARAGTPVGILIRRWAANRWGADWPHYAVSIVRDRGIDLTALRYLAARHDPRRVLFVDGWTGKGAIVRELTEALAAADDVLGLGPRGFDPRLAVLADPGECVSLFGTREDFLIPSACLNATVSGLVSRTVLNPALTGPEEFHGAKFYAALADRDVSARFLDRVTARFDQVADEAERAAAELLAADRHPTWVGWAAAERIRAAAGLPHVNLVKPGVGETTRVLLRRVPWRVVVNPARRGDLRHVELLAAERDVEVVADPDLPYSCVGLIRPTERDGS